MRALRGGQAACGKRGGRRASMVSLLIGLCVFASTDLCVQIGPTDFGATPAHKLLVALRLTHCACNQAHVG